MDKSKDKKEIKFLADKMLGKLVKWLRILGYNTSYSFSKTSMSIILTAREENRILLTRNTNLIKRKNICDFLFIQNDDWEKQLMEVIKGLKLKISFNSKPFSRCIVCNTPTIAVDRETVEKHVPSYVFLTRNHFVYCPSCNKYYWEGTHLKKMKKKIQEFAKK